ncbi:MAG: ABC transporter permease [Candidatus Cloacimonetes bacterium]|nr:ABC transporter permease [Candidatus Cloacimonadota bacterium]
MDTLIADLRYAIRKLAGAPGFTFAALLTLALGIGANSAIFSVVYGVLFRPLPFPDSQQLVRVSSSLNGNPPIDAFSSPNYLDLAELADVFAGAAASSRGTLTLTGAGEPTDLNVSVVSANFFDVLGVRPQLGRAFSPAENEPGNRNVVILSRALWQQRFGGDPGILNQSLLLGGNAFTVVGVMPSGFSYPSNTDVWVPLEYSEAFRSEGSRGGFYLSVIARLRDDVPLERARAAVDALARRIDEAWDPPGFPVTLAMVTTPLREAIIGDVRTPLLVLLAAVGFVLLIACVNVANLLLARASTREAEIAVRTAIGAGRSRIIGQLVTESVVLGLLGGLIGLVLALWGTAAIVGMQPGDLPRISEVRVDGAVIAFTFGISLVAALLFGMLPALQSASMNPYDALREAGRSQVGSRRSQRLRTGLVVAEIAFAVLLLAGAGLLIRSFATLMDVDPGFRSEGLLTFPVGLPGGTYPDDARRSMFVEQYLERVRALPGVAEAAAVSAAPLAAGTLRVGFSIEGEGEVSSEQVMDIRVVTPGYFRLMGIPLRGGRDVEPSDRAGTQPVAVVSEAAVRRYFRDGDPIGRTITMGWARDAQPDGVTATIVGVVADVKLYELGEAPLPTVYFPHAQVGVPGMSIIVRAAGANPLLPVPGLRDELRALDPNLPLDDVQLVDDILADSVAQPRFYMMLLLLFAGVAVILAAVGIFGVMSFAVAQRRREIGIRMALGAPHASVLRLVLREGMLVTAVGIAIGLTAAVALTRVMESLLYGVAATDAVALVGATLILAATALLASCLPARRAASLDPLLALRAD